MAKQKQNLSAVGTTKTTTKTSSSNLKEHNIQHLRLQISGVDSSTSTSTNTNINDMIQTVLLERRDQLRPHYEDLRLELQSYSNRTNTHFDRMEDRLKHIDERLNFVLKTIDEIKKDNQEIIASLSNVLEA